jgi:CHAT domain-containing protein
VVLRRNGKDTATLHQDIEALRQAQLALPHGQKPAGDEVPQEKQRLRVLADESNDCSAAAARRFPMEPWAPYARPFYWAAFMLLDNWQ